MADQYSKDGSFKDQDVSPLFNQSSPFPDLASMFQDQYWNDGDALRWADILSVEPLHPSYDCNFQPSSSLIPDPTIDAPEDDWFNIYGMEDDLSLVGQELTMENPSGFSDQHQTLSTRTLPGKGEEILPGIGNEGSTGSASQVVLSMETISQFFNMSIVQAANELGVTLTTLKLRCRELGFTFWPRRKLKSLQGIINHVKEFGQASGGEIEERAFQIIKVLEDELKRIEKFPDLELAPSTIRLRQVCYKDVHKKKRALEEAASTLLALKPNHESLPLGCSTKNIKSPDHEATADDEEPGSKRTKLVAELYTKQA